MTILEIFFILFKIGSNKHRQEREEEDELAHHGPSQQLLQRRWRQRFKMGGLRDKREREKELLKIQGVVCCVVASIE
jgi:hypothetical protein